MERGCMAQQHQSNVFMEGLLRMPISRSSCLCGNADMGGQMFAFYVIVDVPAKVCLPNIDFGQTHD